MKPGTQLTDLRGQTLPGDGPVAHGARIHGLDTVRGLALFGVLIINLDSEFRVTLFEQFQPAALAAASSSFDRLVSMLFGLLIEFKAFAVFSLLFGIGLAMQFDRLRESSRSRVLVRRLLVLLMFGVIHLTLVWNGDILTEYAIAGLVVIPLLGRSRLTLGVAAAGAMLLYLAVPWIPLPFSFPSADWIDAHVSTARAVYGGGSFLEVLRFRIEELPQIAKLHAYVFPRTVALMLLGALIWRSGVLKPGHGARSPILSAGAVLVVLGAVASITAIPGVAPGWIGSVLAGAAPVLLAVSYAALIWVISSSRLGWLVDWAAPAGQMAFTNYILQSVVLGLLFYGYGAGLMGRLGVSAGLGVSILLFLLQVIASSFWLRSYRYGPFEWAWRSLTYGSVQSWKRPDPRIANGM
ncbi:DUF418 domain-containing protein [Brevundimonas sp. AJA228-03]|uniref:DUF418 domain-containing protein n=1 Tax=Brevundimonas sp. AJA228-03 TaxID=2752515 RepID=UPI001ADF2CFF|nr:DUF418 domain-containing protein [Brevundimonas sp. AJA228-03]QTN18421.1 DUF418 domain-containing protein [Brevundimonas sp. AJA228-03]